MSALERDLAALRLVQRLAQAGHLAYFAGGWVRDLLLGLPPSDIDIATSALPDETATLFERTLPVGLAFGSLVVLFEGHPFEVTTFRKEGSYLDGRRPTKVSPGDAQEDALRRSITINGLFYDPLKDEILDYVGGREDLEVGLIRAIGQPEERFQEDRLRMLRALRYATRFHFSLEPTTADAIRLVAPSLLPAVSPERIWQEFQKADGTGHLFPFLVELHRFHLLQEIFPLLSRVGEEELRANLLPLTCIPLPPPTIFSLALLFFSFSQEEALSQLSFLRLSKQDQQRLYLFWKCREFFDLLLSDHPLTPLDWVELLKEKEAEEILHLFAHRLEPPHRAHLLSRMARERICLLPHLLRAQTQRPLLAAKELLDLGIPPGPQLGRLLAEGERLAIERNTEDPEEVLEALRHSPEWPTH